MGLLDEYFGYQTSCEAKYGRNTIVLYENGHFFEIYGVENEFEQVGQARRISEILNIVCTRKNKKIVENSRSNPLLVGVPSHSLQKYLNVLIGNQFTVCLVEQVTTPPNPRRELTRVISPSTYICEQQRPDYNFVACVYGIAWEQKQWVVGISAFDPSTGHTFTYSTHTTRGNDVNYVSEDIFRVLETLDPRELIIYMEQPCPFRRDELESQWELGRRVVYWLPDDSSRVFERLSFQEAFLGEWFPNHGMLTAIEYLQMERNPELVMSFCLLLQFAREHDRNLLVNVSPPKIWERDMHLLLHHNSVYQLNLLPDPTVDGGGSLRSILDLLQQTGTPMGRRLVRDRLLNPIRDVRELESRYDLLEKWCQLESVMRDHIRRDLRTFCDLERFWRRMNMGVLHPHELSSLEDMFEATSLILGRLDGKIGLNFGEQNAWLMMREEINGECLWEEMAKWRLEGIQGNIFKTGQVDVLDELQSSWDETWEGFTGIARQFIETMKKKGEKVTDDWIKCEFNERDGYHMSMTNKRKETLMKYLTKTQHEKFEFKSMPSNGVKIMSPILEKWSKTLIEIKKELQEKVREIYLNKIKNWAVKYQNVWTSWVHWVSVIDLLDSFGRVSTTLKYVRPQIEDSCGHAWVRTRGLRHALIERLQTGVAYVPNDVELKGDGMLIFGLNGGGKSSLLKAIGVSIILAQIGMFVPADEFIFWPFHGIYTRIMGTDNLLKGQSSFMVEMQELRTILREADKNTLVLGDEICRGTETASAISLVGATVERLLENQVNFLFATHLHSLEGILKDRDRLQWWHVEVSSDGEKLCFGRKLKPGVGPSTYGLEVATHILQDDVLLERALQIRSSITQVINQEKGEKVEKVEKVELSKKVRATRRRVLAR